MLVGTPWSNNLSSTSIPTLLPVRRLIHQVEKQHVLVPGRRDGNRWISRSKLRDDDLMHFRPIASFDSSLLQYPAPGELGITSLSCLSCPLRSFPSVSPKTSCKTANPLRLIYRSHGSYITFGRPLSTALNTKHQTPTFQHDGRGFCFQPELRQ
jgi:hypothetical protein